jgi:hypothetical protein
VEQSREVLPQHCFSDVRSDRGEGQGGCPGSFTRSQSEKPGFFLKKISIAIYLKKILKKRPDYSIIFHKKPAQTVPVKK